MVTVSLSGASLRGDLRTQKYLPKSLTPGLATDNTCTNPSSSVLMLNLESLVSISSPSKYHETEQVVETRQQSISHLRSN